MLHQYTLLLLYDYCIISLFAEAVLHVGQVPMLVVNKQAPGTNFYNSEYNFSEGITGVSCGPLSVLLFTVEFSILLNTLL